ncbi:TetR family transcriptional regulator [Pectobacterium actinidiae]|uniref:TetR family transcriptional regulator n=1 Tax=Pectobacterium actinidiae TaxID=1507808 RepID=A0A1V2R9F4_9GAMM|nr:TetR/AcrR family transcriptional regulator [Pectobacterium actinidiae]KHN90101.1 bacterial regulatory s, tetR family protein [Pectobacterium actinidiae]ONK07006.1 TetR family transcriptional regulator [Pectobacterium actinidiae]ONK09079.1 TetR family transcriptional regulator [Pectobacterium actinidiae]
MRKKTEARRLQFVMAAGKLFMDHGFAAVTMESIAAEATSSKVTLYNYFSSKEALFEAYLLEAGKGMVERLLDSSTNGQTRDETLHHLGRSYLELVTKPDIVALNRLTIGEAGRFPELSRLFYTLGPKRTLSSIEEVMSQLMEKGWIRQAEVRKVSLHFKALCEAEMLERILWGLEPVEVEPDVLEAAALSGVEAFIQLYGKE